jgi:uncharacterized membrane protein YuzA (DUF378 family)
MRRLNSGEWILLILLIVGGLNWGLVGLFGFDLVAAIFGVGTMLTRLVYILVGVSALYFLARYAMDAYTPSTVSTTKMKT